jgi:hypothetical protein
MNASTKLLLTSLFILLPALVAAQQTASSSSQGSQLLQQSLAALQGNTSLTDVTLSGTARRIAGSDDESGTAVLKALASGAGRSDLTLSSGQRSEVENLTATPPTGSWSGSDGVSHSMAFHNLLTEPSWFFPAFAISRRISGSGFVATYVGHETHNGQAVEHVSVSHSSQISSTPAGSVSPEHLTQVDFFLDSTTLLPVAISFNIHPDHNALLDIPVEVRFNDYRAVNTAQVPFHVQQFINNSLLLDFQAESVTFNSGLSATNFNLP